VEVKFKGVKGEGIKTLVTTSQPIRTPTSNNKREGGRKKKGRKGGSLKVGGWGTGEES